jgi:hypothetical protein
VYVQRSHCVNTRHIDTWYRPQNEHFNTTSIVHYLGKARRVIVISERALIEEEAMHMITANME